MIIRVRGAFRVPHNLFAEYSFAVDDRAGLAVAGAEIESHPAPVQMPAQRNGCFLRRGNRVSRGYHHLKRALVYRSHEVKIKLPRSLRRIDRLYVLTNLAGTANVQLPSSALPEQELHHALDKEKCCFQVIGWRNYRCVKARNRSVSAF